MLVHKPPAITLNEEAHIPKLLKPQHLLRHFLHCVKIQRLTRRKIRCSKERS